MDKEDLQKFVNQIFKRKGFPPVRNFAKEFADGILFELLFNIMYDEKINCRLVPSAIIEDRILNWSKINCKSFSDSLFAHKSIFSYLQLRSASTIYSRSFIWSNQR